MKTRVVDASSEGWLEEALALLRAGDLVAFPTDTVYGLGADPLQAEAVAGLYRAKGRPAERPIPLLLAEVSQMEVVAREVSAAARELAASFWPGPLSLVLPARREVPSIVTAGGDTVALRMPAHEVPLRLIAAFGRPLAVTSANLSGEPAPLTAEDVLGQLRGRLPLVVDGAACPGGQPSTVLSLAEEPPRVLRAGPVTWEEIAACLGLH